VTMGGTNSLAVVPLSDEDEDDERDSGPGNSLRIGLIPTGWYPSSVSVSADGSHLYVVNAISPALQSRIMDRLDG
jgi:DNA-binding beta-propeller fold protein YncE